MKRYLLLIMTTVLCLSVHAQQKKEKYSKEEFQAKQEAYITKQAGLTAEEASKFFPIYYELKKKKKEINNLAWKNAKKGKEPQTTEKEYEDILNGFITAEEQNNALDKEYLKKYQKVLSNKKIYMVLRAEIKFHRNMLKILQEQPTPKK